jgi:hypothetical protein
MHHSVTRLPYGYEPATHSLTIESVSDGDPVEVLRRDKVLLALCMSYIAIMFIMLYL